MHFLDGDILLVFILALRVWYLEWVLCHVFFLHVAYVSSSMEVIVAPIYLRYFWRVKYTFTTSSSTIPKDCDRAKSVLDGLEFLLNVTETHDDQM